jgi:hypothetical protein
MENRILILCGKNSNYPFVPDIAEPVIQNSGSNHSYYLITGIVVNCLN